MAPDLSENFYTASQAQKRLGLSKSSFFDLVRKGTITKVTLPGKVQGVYPKALIDNLAATIYTTLAQYERDTSVFELATLDDLPIEVGIDLSLYGRKGTTPLEQRIERMEKNPEGNYVLRNEGEIVGHVAFYPIEKEYLLDLLHARVSGIPVEKVQLFEPGQPLQVMFSIMSVKPGFPPEVANHSGQRLIAGTVQVFKKLAERGILIENIYATSRTHSGIKLGRKLGMIGEPIENERGRMRFTLNVATSDSLLVREYKERLCALFAIFERMTMD